MSATETAQSILELETRRIVDVLVKEYQPQKIIIYGSAARGAADQWSDLDLVIIKNTRQRFFDRIGEVLRLIRPRVSIDILVYTPQEFDRMSRENWFVGEEIARKGRVLYGL